MKIFIQSSVSDPISQECKRVEGGKKGGGEGLFLKMSPFSVDTRRLISHYVTSAFFYKKKKKRFA